jgi:carboxyl-terminal processing protease
MQGQKSPRQDFQAEPAKAITKLPLQVLINRGTSGAAEVAAAALLDTKRAQVAGERTYGAAAVRKAVTMDDGGAIILSVAKYYSPSGKSIQIDGVTPASLVAEPEPAIEFDDDGNPIAQDDATAPKKDPEAEQKMLKRFIEIWK